MAKTMIAVPCMDSVAAPFAQSLASLNRDGQVCISMIIGSLIYESRNNLAKQAIQIGADYILWLDSDMIFAPDTMTRMLKHMENGCDVVSAIYFRRRAPFTPVLFKTLNLGAEPSKRWTGYDDYPRNELFELDGIGFGCCMTKTSIFADLFVNEKNCFEPLGGFGEDLSFCIRAKRAGYKIWCDSSIKCGHVGQVIVDENVFLQNFAPEVINNAGKG